MTHIGFVDVESSDGKREISEVYMAVFEYDEKTCVCTLVSEFHRICQVRPSMYDDNITLNVTGLYYMYLQQNGVTFTSMIHDLQKWIAPFKTVEWYARDPQMENRTIARYVRNLFIKEYCDILMMPWQKLYATKAGRLQLDLPAYDHCGHHHMTSYEDHLACHCAKRDVWHMMYVWSMCKQYQTIRSIDAAGDLNAFVTRHSAGSPQQSLPINGEENAFVRDGSPQQSLPINGEENAFVTRLSDGSPQQSLPINREANAFVTPYQRGHLAEESRLKDGTSNACKTRLTDSSQQSIPINEDANALKIRLSDGPSQQSLPINVEVNASTIVQLQHNWPVLQSESKHTYVVPVIDHIVPKPITTQQSLFSCNTPLFSTVVSGAAKSTHAAAASVSPVLASANADHSKLQRYRPSTNKNEIIKHHEQRRYVPVGRAQPSDDRRLYAFVLTGRCK